MVFFILTKKAKDYFLGLEGKNLNCYQSVVYTFKDVFNLVEEDIEEGLRFSGGRAPEGICGAIYAVKKLYEKKGNKDFDEFKNRFIEQNGSIICYEIRKKKKISCAECVEIATEYLEKNNSSN